MARDRARSSTYRRTEGVRLTPRPETPDRATTTDPGRDGGRRLELDPRPRSLPSGTAGRRVRHRARLDPRPKTVGRRSRRARPPGDGGLSRRRPSSRPSGRYFRDDGRRTRTSRGQRYKLAPLLRAPLKADRNGLIVLANFVEVFLAKEGHDGVVGINYLEKIQLPTLPSLYGAMLAKVDVVLMGAGIPIEIPAVLDRLTEHLDVTIALDVLEAGDRRFELHFDPTSIGLGPASERPTCRARPSCRSSRRRPWPRPSCASRPAASRDSSSRARSPAATTPRRAASCSSTTTASRSTASATSWTWSR